jgi:hypothetical protein
MSTPQRNHSARAFGLALRAARLERGLSQEDLAERGDFDRTYPSLLEHGRRVSDLLRDSPACSRPSHGACCAVCRSSRGVAQGGAVMSADDDQKDDQGRSAGNRKPSGL